MQKYRFFVGIDMSKQWFDACVYDSHGQHQPVPHRFNNQAVGFSNFVTWLKQLPFSQAADSYWICIEHTGIYSLALAHFLAQQPVAFVLESALRIKRSLGLHRHKTDQADARAIAQYAWRFHQQHKTRSLPVARLLQLQALLSFRKRLVRYRQGLRVAANELASVPDEIKDCVQEPSSLICKQIKDQIRQIDRHIRQLIQTDVELCRLDRLIRSIKGIGPLISAYLLVYTNAFSAFEKPRAFACYIGIAPFQHRSGSSIYRPDRVSFLANRKLKALLSTAAVVAIQHDPQLKAYFKRQLARNKQPGWIYNAVKNKLVHRIFAVVKRGTPYVIIDQHLAS